MKEMTDTITMVHGSGGAATGELIRDVFAAAFSSPMVDAMEDAAVVAGDERIAVTTDSFVVTPLFYKGGDIGRLSVCGTVNDLLMRGAVPRYLTCGFILEEGLPVAQLGRIAGSMAKTAKEAGVSIICGDTKVVEGRGGVYINTTGVGFVPKGVDIAAANAVEGDRILVSGTLGDHHATILGARLSVENGIESDNAPLLEMVDALRPYGVHVLRDVTRGGLATVLCELAAASGKTFTIEEERVPVSEGVRDFCGILGLDPLYMGNEGKLVAIVDEADAEAALKAIRASRYGGNAACIGSVEKSPAGKGAVYVRTAIGGKRRLMELQDEGLPRIC